ncbi:MAG: L-fucokinase, partial [Eggerthellaceae bacterium]|nr:L-fucokinase [Eggerthellaceae bacterium]
VDDRGQVDIDTGCVWFGKVVVEALLSLISTKNAFDQEKFDAFVNQEACLSLYADFLYPLASNATLDGYLKEIPENVFNEQLVFCRKAIWEALRPYSLRLVRLMPSRYIHFGTTWEMRELLTKKIEAFSYLGWHRQVESFNAGSTEALLNNAYVDKGANISSSCYVEDSYIGTDSVIGDGSIVSHITVLNSSIPDQVVINGIQTHDKKWICRIYGITDNPKESSGAQFLASSLDTIIATTGVDPSEVWESAPASVWNAKIYPVCETEQDALEAALILFRISQGCATKDEIVFWNGARKESLHSSFSKADAQAMVLWEKELSDKIAVALFVSELAQGKSSVELIDGLRETTRFENRLIQVYEQAECARFPLNMRLYLALADILKNENKIVSLLEKTSKDFEQSAYDVVKEGIVSALQAHNPLANTKTQLFKLPVSVDLPVRVNFCGSPSDAAPYCIEHGGTMLDGAVLLKGILPVHAEIRSIDERAVVFTSKDQEETQKYTNLETLKECGNPYDPFALHKACLIASGVLDSIQSFDELLAVCQGGIELTTSVDVPKGSGLGTSSILAAACVKAIDRAFGVNPSNDLIYEQVFAAEQLMGTCGGWQDQVGGLTPGIKYFTSCPGMRQTIAVEHLELSPSVKEELQNRFVLVFSGQRRLARNVLRQETNQLIRNDRNAIQAIDRIQELATLMRFYLLKGNITAFAQCMTEQLDCIKVLDRGATNTCVDYIFQICDDLIDGKSVCGAGGGGFLQMILKPQITKEMFIQRIKDEFHGCGVEVWDAALFFDEDSAKGIA